MQDRQLDQLAGYLVSTKRWRQVGWVGDSLDCIQPHLFADADLAGCVASQRSTSGVHHVLRGPNTSFPVAAASKRQGCVSHSTPEAELIALNFAVRTVGLPGLLIWHTLMPKKPALYVHEDNQPLIRVLKTGKNPTMRYLGRTHRVSVAWLHECFQRKDLPAAFEEPPKPCADMHA